MPEDSSLDAFASSEADEEDDAESVSTTETTETDSAAEAAESVEPAVSTYAWSPEGATCADCGESVAKRWRAAGQQGGDLVCEDCKEW